MDTARSVQSDGGRSSGNGWKDFIERLIRNKRFSYLYLISIVLLFLVNTYLLFLLVPFIIEVIVKGCSEFDIDVLFIRYLFGFTGLLGVIGEIFVLSTRAQRHIKYKVMFFIPSLVCSILSFLHIVQHPVGDWLYRSILSAILLCVFVLFNVVKKVELPYFR